MRFKEKKPRTEKFIGNFRVIADEQTHTELNRHIRVGPSRNYDGTVFTKYADGSIEIESVYDRITNMVKEIHARDELNDINK